MCKFRLFIVHKHVELIDELLKIEDISKEILDHIDMEEMDNSFFDCGCG